MQKNMTHVTLSIETLNLMLDFISSQTWKEANPIIVAVHKEIIPQLTGGQIKTMDPAIEGGD